MSVTQAGSTYYENFATSWRSESLHRGELQVFHFNGFPAGEQLEQWAEELRAYCDKRQDAQRFVIFDLSKIDSSSPNVPMIRKGRLICAQQVGITGRVGLVLPLFSPQRLVVEFFVAQVLHMHQPDLALRIFPTLEKALDWVEAGMLTP